MQTLNLEYNIITGTSLSSKPISSTGKVQRSTAPTKMTSKETVVPAIKPIKNRVSRSGKKKIVPPKSITIPNNDTTQEPIIQDDELYEIYEIKRLNMIPMTTQRRHLEKHTLRHWLLTTKHPFEPFANIELPIYKSNALIRFRRPNNRDTEKIIKTKQRKARRNAKILLPQTLVEQIESSKPLFLAQLTPTFNYQKR